MSPRSTINTSCLRIILLKRYRKIEKGRLNSNLKQEGIWPVLSVIPWLGRACITSFFLVKYMVLSQSFHVCISSFALQFFCTNFATNHSDICSFRSSHQRCSMKKCVLKNFTKFTEKHLRQSLYSNLPQTSEFCEIFKNSFFREYLWWLLQLICRFSLRLSYVDYYYTFLHEMSC